MKRRPRIYYSDGQKALMWERWKQGWMLNEIGRLFDRPHTSIQQIFVRTGGIQPTARSRALMAAYRAHRMPAAPEGITGQSARLDIYGRLPPVVGLARTAVGQ